MPDIYRIVNSLLATNTYICKLSSNECIIIDPGSDADLLLQKLNDLKSNPIAILATHGHFDHIAGVMKMQNAYPECRFYLHESDLKTMKISNFMMKMFGLDGKIALPKTYITFNEDWELDVAGEAFKIKHTPGHTLGSCVVQVGTNLFTGDTLFYSKISSKIPNENIELLKASEFEIQHQFDGETKIYPGHGEPGLLKNVKK